MTKKERIKAKRLLLKNKKLLKQYPWLKIPSYRPEHGKHRFEYTYNDDMPKGWRIAFSKMLYDEINEYLDLHPLYKKNFCIEQVKEKYGGLRMYFFPYDEQIDRIINKYSVLSENICIVCGKPDVPMTNGGWIYPCCSECYCKNNEETVAIYQRITEGNDNIMSNTMEWIKYKDDKNIHCCVDISDTAKKIRQHYYKRKEKSYESNRTET